MENKLNENSPSFWEVCRNHAWIISGFVIVFPILGFVLNGMAQDKWEAEAIVQVGEIGSVMLSGSKLIEPIPRAIERLKSEAFKDAALRSEELNVTKQGSKDLYRTTFSAYALPAKTSTNSNLIKLKLKALAPEDAKNLMRTVIKQLVLSHNKIVKSRLALLKDRQFELAEELRRTKEELAGGQPRADSRQLQEIKNNLYSELRREKEDNFLIAANRLQEITNQISSETKFGPSVVELSYGQVMKPRLDFLKNRRLGILDELRLAKKELAALGLIENRNQLERLKRNLYLSLFREKGKRIASIEENLQNIKNQISSEVTFGTNLIEDVYVKEKPAKYGNGVILMLGLFFGGVFGMAYALVANYFVLRGSEKSVQLRE